MAMSATAIRSAPSVSPLSNASKTKNTSPMTIRDVDLHTDHDSAAPNRVRPTDVDLADDASSSLSEPEDDENDDDSHHNGIGARINIPERSSISRMPDVDSEAETERLDTTPQKQRKLADDLGKTPSKLSQAATADEELSEPPSPLQLDPGATSSTSTGKTIGKKRKRSVSAESSLTSAESDVGDSPRKRNHNFPVDGVADVEDVIDNLEQPDEIAQSTEYVLAQGEVPEIPIEPSKGHKGRKSKYKGRKQKIHMEEVDIEPIEETAGAEDDTNEESATRTEEELRQRKEASSVFEEVARQFRGFREKLYNERLASMSAELQLLSQPHCEHPEFLRQVACVDARLQKQRKETHAFYTFKLRCIRERTLGERSQLHSQYFQHIRQIREDVLDKLSANWYDIQKERRQSHQDSDDAYVYKFPEKKSAQIRQQAKYNQEVSVLSGMAKHVGFPAAPEITGVGNNDLENDLKAMKISKRAPQPAQPSHSVYLPNSASKTIVQNELLAHEKFIEQNAWARPQAAPPMLTHGTPGISHTPDWAAEPGGSQGRIRPSEQIHRPGPFTTPASQHLPPTENPQSSDTIFAMNSDGTEPPSSVAAEPPTANRIAFSQQQRISDVASPSAMPKQRYNGTVGASAPSSATPRDISSTITNVPPSNPSEHHIAATTSSATKPDNYTIAAHHKSNLPNPLADLQFHRPRPSDDDLVRRGDTFPASSIATSFRPQEGAFGTPAPLLQPPIAPSASSNSAADAKARA